MGYEVSVIIPIYNSYMVAIEAINSVLNQDFDRRRIEIILVNDGSTCSVPTEFSKICARHSHIKYFRTDNMGAAAARNYGAEQSSARYLAFLDSDDTWAPKKLSRQIVFFEKYLDLGMIGSLTDMKNFSLPRKFNTGQFVDIELKDLLFKNYFQTSTVMIRRTVFIELEGFPDGRRYAEEGDLFLRIAFKYRTILLLENLVSYSSGKDGFGHSGLSANLLMMEQGELMNLFNSYRRGDISTFWWFNATLYSMSKFVRRLCLLLVRRAN